ncbi:hypothetical protein U9R90_36500 [Streptomyces sp. E11-3]|uniref:hypothetical protein n=1 Tax=Streptomyces sp. E11-3 TaxID=3110112 RepID=UPI00397F478D
MTAPRRGKQPKRGRQQRDEGRDAERDGLGLPPEPGQLLDVFAEELTRGLRASRLSVGGRR